jgi:transcriptional regulator with XRE-family HTH domain
MESAANVRSGTGARVRHVRGGEAQERFAARYGVSVATVRNYESGNRDPAAEFLAALAADGWNINWLLTGEGPERSGGGLRVAEPLAAYGAPSQDLSAEHLSIALELADEALRGLWLPRRGYAELVALVYDALTQGLPYASILDIARPAARERAGEGDSDVGEQGLDRAGPEGSGRSAAS